MGGGTILQILFIDLFDFCQGVFGDVKFDLCIKFSEKFGKSILKIVSLNRFSSSFASQAGRKSLIFKAKKYIIRVAAEKNFSSKKCFYYSDPVFERASLKPFEPTAHYSTPFMRPYQSISYDLIVLMPFLKFLSTLGLNYVVTRCRYITKILGDNPPDPK